MSQDQARVTVLVEVPQEDAFRVFTEQIDQWWRRGRRYRQGRTLSLMYLEPFVGGRLFERIETDGGEVVAETGRVLVWSPPSKLVLEWRATNFQRDERTEVEVEFEPVPAGTQVTLTHRGWSRIRSDHPVRHGQAPQPFLRTMGMWWGALLTSYRMLIRDESP